MESKTKKILAVVIIAVVATGIGVGLWIFQGPTSGVLYTPGVPEGTPNERIIRVGILGPLSDIQGDGMFKGAWLACSNINKAGGVKIGNVTYYFGIIAEDTFESDAQLDISKGVSAAQKIVTQDQARYIIGGFRTESVTAYREIIMDKQMIFIDTGAATDYFCKNVTDNYSHYKYFFRIMPINSTALGKELFTYLAYLKAYLTAVQGRTINKVAILREDLSWTMPLNDALKAKLPALGFNITAQIAYPITAGLSDFATYWSQIDANQSQICIPIISAQGGILMTTQYAALHPKCLIAGIDVMSQLDTYWNDTLGGCQYEVTLQSTIRTNKTTKTIAFWDNFTATYDSEPLYTAVGSYDGMYLLLDAINKTQSLDSNDNTICGTSSKMPYCGY
jgi:ABC-type branched-subunit amino acid transport system substrate-binding protein